MKPRRRSVALNGGYEVAAVIRALTAKVASQSKTEVDLANLNDCFRQRRWLVRSVSFNPPDGRQNYWLVGLGLFRGAMSLNMHEGIRVRKLSCKFVTVRRNCKDVSSAGIAKHYRAPYVEPGSRHIGSAPGWQDHAGQSRGDRSSNVHLSGPGQPPGPGQTGQPSGFFRGQPAAPGGAG